MKFQYENIFIIKNNKRIRVKELKDLTILSGINLFENFFIRDDLKKQVFINISNTNILLSNSLKELYNQSDTHLEINEDIIPSYKECGFIPSPHTIFKNVLSLQYYSGLNVSNNVMKIEKFYPKKVKAFDNQREFEVFFENNLINLETNKVFLFFSGGADSLFIFYNLIKNKVNFHNIIVKMKGMKKDFNNAFKISKYYKREALIYDKFDKKAALNIASFIEDEMHPVQDPIVPVYKEIVFQNLRKGNEVFFDGQGADTLLMGLPHNLLINLHSPHLRGIYYFANLFFKIKLTPNTTLKRIYYRIGKVLNSLSKKDWISCFLSSIEIEESSKLYSEFHDILSDNFSYFKCKHKSISFFFLSIILDSREMQKYRGLKKNVKVRLPFLDNKLIEKVFSTPTNFFINNLNKKIPIYSFINKFKFKLNNFKTSPFYVDYKINENNENIYEYSLDIIKKTIIK